MSSKISLTYKKTFWFWLPLAAMWVMMSLEQPAIAAVMARLPNPEPNLAAFGITFSFALFVEGPVIMLLTAGTALPEDKQSYDRLLHFTHILAAGMTAIHLLIAIPPVYRFLVGVIIGAPPEIISLSREAFLILTPWTSMIAYRRVWQGVLIKYDRTIVVPITIAARLVVTTAGLGIGLLLGRYAGAYVGATALSFGVITAAIVAYAFARSTIREHLSEPAPDATAETLTWGDLLEFYVPLALTPLIMLLAHPLLSIGLARAQDPLASLAVWPVITSFLFLGRSIALSFQEAVVALLDDRQSFQTLRRFAVWLAVILGSAFAVAAVTPIARFWYADVSGLSSRLVGFSLLPTMIIALVPGVAALISWQRGLLIHVKRTQPITESVAVNVVVLLTVMVVLMQTVALPGATLAAIALSASVFAEWAYLWWRSRPEAERVQTPAPVVAGD